MDKQMVCFKIQNEDGTFTDIKPITDTIDERIKELANKMNAVEAKSEEKTACREKPKLNVFRLEGSESLNVL